MKMDILSEGVYIMSIIQIICLVVLIIGSATGSIIFFYNSWSDTTFTILGAVCLIVCIVALAFGAFGVFGS